MAVWLKLPELEAQERELLTEVQTAMTQQLMRCTAAEPKERNRARCPTSSGNGPHPVGACTLRVVAASVPQAANCNTPILSAGASCSLDDSTSPSHFFQVRKRAGPGRSLEVRPGAFHHPAYVALLGMWKTGCWGSRVTDRWLAVLKNRGR